MYDLIKMLEPPQAFVDDIRLVNIVIGFFALLVLLVYLAIPRWKTWSTPLRLGWMSLTLLVFTGTYGTFEVTYLNTYLRVPMVTVSLIWVVVACLWPPDKDGSNSREG